ncbi:MAG: ABC transporter permease [Thermodesulfobacteriota bacterium]
MDFLLEGIVAAFRLIVGLDQEVYAIVFLSVRVSVLATVYASLLGIPPGVWVALHQFRGKGALLLCLNTLMALPTVVVGVFMYGLISRRGVFGELDLLFAPGGIVLGLTALIVPLVMNLTIAAIHATDPRLVTTCRALGATGFQTSWKVVQEAGFAVIAAVVVAFGRVISEVGIAMMLGGNIRGYTRTITTAIALETSKGEFALGMALGIILLLVSAGVNAALFLLQRRQRW